METKTYPLESDEDLWERYKDTVPRSKNLEDPIIEFLEARVQMEGDETLAIVQEAEDDEESLTIVRRLE